MSSLSSRDRLPRQSLVFRQVKWLDVPSPSSTSCFAWGWRAQSRFSFASLCGTLVALLTLLRRRASPSRFGAARLPVGSVDKRKYTSSLSAMLPGGGSRPVASGISLRQERLCTKQTGFGSRVGLRNGLLLSVAPLRLLEGMPWPNRRSVVHAWGRSRTSDVATNRFGPAQERTECNYQKESNHSTGIIFPADGRGETPEPTVAWFALADVIRQKPVAFPFPMHCALQPVLDAL